MRVRKTHTRGLMKTAILISIGIIILFSLNIEREIIKKFFEDAIMPGIAEIKNYFSIVTTWGGMFLERILNLFS